MTNPRRFELNRSAVFEDTIGVAPSQPLHTGHYDEREDQERLLSCYSLFHGPKHYVLSRNSNIYSKPSSLKLLRGTNEFAEDLTGQREPLNTSRWSSETKAQYLGRHIHRPMSTSGGGRNLLISQMRNQDSIFDRTNKTKENQFCDTYPHKEGAVSTQRFGDMYQTTYSFQHRPFTKNEQLEGSHWDRDRLNLPWLQDPLTHQQPVRVPQDVGVQRFFPTEAQVSTLPHYIDPSVKLGRSEVQESFSDPYKAEDFYHQPLKIRKSHLEPSYIN